ncbi:hypothetical protein SDRG_08446 [Saprolegnia diclina VS20]|uniref:Uncharacterized protein n=1 Tax=Saprolegnia diclina (strain VS20) TaxID=1156394 RepID=T0Q8L4_SAPDV|nr:hypothetical protein SDRG_08446 [Saprolegnia diclina VS20]EQC34244.1 hypothetical protein SDRG_08446 [Saprolegnia diclina VS20]|eukprot:XP_008612556.1 hypothetical protein SDRG_08446 [Saprolegnia diclina VS20]
MSPREMPAGAVPHGTKSLGLMKTLRCPHKTCAEPLVHKPVPDERLPRTRRPSCVREDTGAAPGDCLVDRSRPLQRVLLGNSTQSPTLGLPDQASTQRSEAVATDCSPLTIGPLSLEFSKSTAGRARPTSTTGRLPQDPSTKSKTKTLTLVKKLTLSPREESQVNAAAARVTDLNKLRVHTIEVDTASPRHDHPRKYSAYLFSSPQGGYGVMACNQSPNLESFRLDKFTGEAMYPGLGSLFADYMVRFNTAVRSDEFFHCTTWTDEHKYQALKMCLGPEPADWVRANEAAWMAATPNYGYRDLALRITEHYAPKLEDDQVLALMRKAKRYGDTWALHAHYMRYLQRIARIPSSTVLDIFCSYACPEHTTLLAGHIDERRRNDPAMLDELVQHLVAVTGSGFAYGLRPKRQPRNERRHDAPRDSAVRQDDEREYAVRHDAAREDDASNGVARLCAQRERDVGKDDAHPRVRRHGDPREEDPRDDAKCQDDDKCDAQCRHIPPKLDYARPHAKRCDERCAKREDERWDHEHCHVNCVRIHAVQPVEDDECHDGQCRDDDRQVEQRDDDDPHQDNQAGDDDQRDDDDPRQDDQDLEDNTRDDATCQDDAKHGNKCRNDSIEQDDARQHEERRDKRRYHKDDCMTSHAVQPAEDDECRDSQGRDHER